MNNESKPISLFIGRLFAPIIRRRSCDVPFVVDSYFSPIYTTRAMDLVLVVAVGLLIIFIGGLFLAKRGQPGSNGALKSPITPIDSHCSATCRG